MTDKKPKILYPVNQAFGKRMMAKFPDSWVDFILKKMISIKQT